MIRPESSNDADAIRSVEKAAFGQNAEADLVDQIRAAGGWQISLVAERDESIVGHVLFTEVTIDAGDHVFSAVGLAPMAVIPEHQRSGIGGELVRAGLRECRAQGKIVVVVLGHPEYYPRFGFERADRYDITYVDPVPAEAFMVFALDEGALDGIRGVVRFRKEFDQV